MMVERTSVPSNLRRSSAPGFLQIEFLTETIERERFSLSPRNAGMRGFLGKLAAATARAEPRAAAGNSAVRWRRLMCVPAPGIRAGGFVHPAASFNGPTSGTPVAAYHRKLLRLLASPTGFEPVLPP